MNQIQAYPTSGVVVPKQGDGDFGAGAGVAPAVDKTGTGTYVSSENESHRANAPAAALGNSEVLEQDAQTKGRWFQYVKTKQFWITLLLGQGTCKFQLIIIVAMNWLGVVLMFGGWNSPRDLHHVYKHALYTSRERGHVDSGVPILLQLRSAQSDLHDLHDL